MAEENIVIDTATGRQKVGSGGGGGGQPLSYTGAVNETLTTGSPGPLVVGGFEIDGSITGTFTFRLVGRYTATGAVGDCELRLYDTGAPGTPAARVLRSIVKIVFADAGATDSFGITLTPAAVPGVDDDEIHNVARVYELDAAIAGSDGETDVFKLHRGSIEVA